MTAAPSPVAELAPVTTGDAELLIELRGCVLRLLAELPRLPQRLTVNAGHLAIELEWPAGPLPVSPSSEPEPPVPACVPVTSSGHGVTAPTVGTFYRAPEPGARAFVEVGDTIRAGQQVGIVEAMKLMLPVEADQAGVVTEVVKSDGEPVEYGEVLMVIEPADPGGSG